MSKLYFSPYLFKRYNKMIQRTLENLPELIKADVNLTTYTMQMLMAHSEGDMK